MKAIFWQHPEHKRERDLAIAVAMGAKACGDEVQILDVTSGEPEVRECDLVMKVGVKSRDWFKAYRQAGIGYCYFDKGYIRTRALVEWLDYWRMAVNGHQPTRYVEKSEHDRKRADAMDLELKPWQRDGNAIIVDGSSAKHYYFHDLGHPTPIARALVEQLRGCGRPIIYRPKPSWRDATPIEGTEFSRDKDIRPDLRRAHVLITFGSNACFDAVLAGVPAIVLGDGIARPISSTSLDDLENPRRASEGERRQWLNNCAWCQFKLAEFRSGMGWRTIKAMAECLP